MVRIHSRADLGKGGGFYCTILNGTPPMKTRGIEGCTDWPYCLDANVAYKPERADGKFNLISPVNNLLDLRCVETQ